MSHNESVSEVRFGSFKLLYYITWVVMRLIGIICGMRCAGATNIPKSGPFVFASNHQHGLDPFMLGGWISRQVYFYAKAELWNNKIVGWIISRTNAFPVKRDSIDRNAFKQTKKVFEHGYGLVFFPEGTREIDDQFLKPKPGIGMILKLVHIGVPVVPVYLYGTRDLWGCFLRKKRLTLIIGNPISAEDVAGYLTGKKGYQALAERIMLEIRRLKEQPR